MKPERLDKLLAGQSTHSRSEVREWIRKGRVFVNGELERAPECKITPERDEIAVDGEPICLQKHIYLMLDKPKGVVSATRDGRERTVVDLVPPKYRRSGLFPAGRLDKDTTGFVLITDDGAFAHRILSPKNHIPKTYLAELDGPVNLAVIQAFSEGFTLGEDDVCHPAQLTVLETGERELVRVVITQGMYHQIKRMFAHFGRTVLALRRIRMGSLELDTTLGEGGCRTISEVERTLLESAPEDVDL